MPVGLVAVAALVVLVVDLIARRDGTGTSRSVSASSGRSPPARSAARQFGHDYNAFFGGFMTGGFTTVFEEIVLLAASDR